MAYPSIAHPHCFITSSPGEGQWVLLTHMMVSQDLWLQGLILFSVSFIGRRTKVAPSSMCISRPLSVLTQTDGLQTRSLFNFLKLINYSCSSYPTRASEKRVENTAVFENLCLKRFQTRMQIFLICILIKQQKHVAINNFI